MQEAELKEKEKRRISEEEKKQKEEGIKAETREAITIWRGKQERPAGVVSPAIPSLQTRPFKGIKTKIEAFSTEIREIKPIKREIQKISIKTRLFRAINRRIFAFNTTIPTLEQRIINLAVPVLAPKHFHESKARNIHLNLELPKIRALPRIISVPRIGVKSFSEVKAKERTFVSGVIERGKGKEEVKEIEVTSEKEETGEVGEGLLDALFAPIEKEHDLKGMLHASPERPIIILAEKSEDDYIDALKLILREIYRIKVGGFPKVRVTKKEKEEVEDVKAERRIHVIDDDLEDKFFGFFKLNEVDMDKLLKERIDELFAQGFGFLVF
ncbi:MAG: hypothetical protein QMD80_07500, partial [archaeon]|nr:hypothetical protein [archaeon]